MTALCQTCLCLAILCTFTAGSDAAALSFHASNVNASAGQAAGVSLPNPGLTKLYPLLPGANFNQDNTTDINPPYGDWFDQLPLYQEVLLVVGAGIASGCIISGVMYGVVNLCAHWLNARRVARADAIRRVVQRAAWNRNQLTPPDTPREADWRSPLGPSTRHARDGSTGFLHDKKNAARMGSMQHLNLVRPRSPELELSRIGGSVQVHAHHMHSPAAGLHIDTDVEVENPDYPDEPHGRWANAPDTPQASPHSAPAPIGQGFNRGFRHVGDASNVSVPVR